MMNHEQCRDHPSMRTKCEHREQNENIDAQHTLLPQIVSKAADSVFEWVKAQKIKHQKESLEKAVEEQRRILSIEALRSEKKRYITRTQQEVMVTSLDSNETFQNMTSTKNTLALCGEGSCFQDSEIYDNHDAEGTVSSKDYNMERSGFCEIKSHSATYEQTFRIGKPCHSLSGQGVAVQLELFDGKESQNTSDTSIIKIYPEANTIPFILNPDQMRDITLNGLLPVSISFAKWKRLYCLQRDGDSFINSFLRKVKGVNRTLLVIQTTNGEVMGGYANSPWGSQNESDGAAFYGSCQASLFKINNLTKKVQVFRWTGSNRYIQVCDTQAKLLAFGGGGKDGSFGLCIEDDFSVGTTGTCETFNPNEPLCEEGSFEILNVECWGFLPGF